MHIGDVERGIGNEIELVVHVEKHEAVNRLAGRDDVRLNHQRLQYLFRVTLFAVAARENGRQAARAWRGRAIWMRNFRGSFLQAQALHMESLIVRRVNVQANRGQVHVHGIFRVVSKIDVDGQQAGLVWINLPESSFNAGHVSARLRGHNKILVCVLGGDFGNIGLLRLRNQREKRERRCQQ